MENTFYGDATLRMFTRGRNVLVSVINCEKYGIHHLTPSLCNLFYSILQKLKQSYPLMFMLYLFCKKTLE